MVPRRHDAGVPRSDLRMRRPLVAVAAFALAALAWAGAPPPSLAEGPSAAPVEIPLRAGTTIKAVVVAIEPAGPVLRGADGKETKTPWGDLAPLGVYRVRAAASKPDDGPSRLALAELASDLGLFAEARAELERAFALKALD